MKNDKKLQDDDRMTTYLHGLNILFIKYFDNKDKDILASIKILKKFYKQFIKNENLWWCYKIKHKRT